MTVVKLPHRKARTEGPGRPRLIRSGLEGAGAGGIDAEVVPFVPAFDLLDDLDRSLTDGEAAAIALALHQLLPHLEEAQGNWARVARHEAVNQRL